MKHSQKRSELREAVASLKPYFVRAAWFSVACSLLVLAPSGYMLEVYDRVVSSRSHTTLAMLTLLVLVMSCLDFGLVSNPCRRRHLALGMRYQQRSA